jgi:hypothetical protein
MCHRIRRLLAPDAGARGGHSKHRAQRSRKRAATEAGLPPCPAPSQGARRAPPVARQVTAAELLRHWGEAGFEAHVRAMQQEYAARAAALQAAAQVRGGPRWAGGLLASVEPGVTAPEVLGRCRDPTAASCAWGRMRTVHESSSVIEHKRCVGGVKST